MNICSKPRLLGREKNFLDPGLRRDDDKRLFVLDEGSAPREQWCLCPLNRVLGREAGFWKQRRARRNGHFNIYTTLRVC
jgi:hypothetical protein